MIKRTKKQKAWIKEYERQTGFDTIFDDEADWDLFVRKNLQWLRDWAEETARVLEHQA